MQYTDPRVQYLTQEEIARRRQIDAYLHGRRKARKRRRRLVGAIAVFTAIIIACASVLSVMVYKDITAPDETTSAGINTAVDEPAVAVQTSAEPEPSEDDTEENEFAEIYYYEEDKLDRYIAYSKEYPELSDEDVVWMVNSHLDKPFYSYDVPTDGYDDPYIIVNKYYTVPEGYNPPDLVNADGVYLRSETAQAYKQMKSAAAADGMSILAVSGYRSVDYQRGLYNSYLANDNQASVDRYSARAGHSEHHTGMAIDLFGSIDGLRNFEFTPEYTWLKENGYKYGFIIRYTAATEHITGYEDEPWHIRYVGADVSTDMRNKGITSFEEYHVKYIAHNPNN